MNRDQNVILRIINIRKQFGPVQALTGVSAEIRKGELVALIGDNSAGKSTLVKILVGAFQPPDGEIYYDNRKLRWNGPCHSRAAGIEMVYQVLGLVADVTHNINHAYHVADRFIVLADGEKIWDVSKNDVFPNQLTRIVIEGKEAFA